MYIVLIFLMSKRNSNLIRNIMDITKITYHDLIAEDLGQLRLLNSMVVDAINQKKQQTRSLIKHTLSVGMQVKVDDARVSHLVGTIQKLNPKMAKVKMSNGITYNVTYSLIVVADQS